MHIPAKTNFDKRKESFKNYYQKNVYAKAGNEQ